MTRSKMLTRLAAAALAVASATALAACSSSGGSSGSASSNSMPGKGKPSFTLGDKNFAEEYLLGHLYADALREKGYTINLKENLGSSELADAALQSGKIDGLPEYTGVIYTELAKLGDQPKSAEVTLQGATKYENGRGVSVLNPTPFQDKDGVAVLNAYAKEHDLKTIGDLSKVGSFTYGGPPENRTRFQGVVGLEKAYGLTKLKFVPLQIGAQYTALDQGKVNTIAIFTTDGQLASGKYTTLTDTKGIFGYQQVVPIIRSSKLKQMGPAFSEICNKVSALLTTKVIIALNKQVQIDKADPDTVAQSFLKANSKALELSS